MNVFNYTLPSGAQYVVRGPAGSTKEQADKIFYEQVASGSLVGYTSGQTLTSIASKIVKFQLSRLDRGTAGVDSAPVLSVIQNLPTVKGIPDLINIPLTNPINTADIVAVTGTGLSPEAIGPLSSFEVQKLAAQVVNIVDQTYTVATRDKGVGKYGFNAYALEQLGYLKPGTVDAYITDLDSFIAVLSSPSVWTGLNGVTTLDDILLDENLQNNMQYQLMAQSYESLLATGVITNPVTSPATVVNGTVYTNSGLQTLSTLGQLGVNLGSLSGVTLNALANNATLGSLISLPVTNLTSIGSGAVNSLIQKSGLGSLSSLNFSSLGSIATTQIAGSVGALINNVTKFGIEPTALWAQAGSLPGIGSLSNLSLSSFSNLSLPSLGNLTSGLDVLGKASQFSVGFANPLSSFNDLGNLSSLGNLGNLSDLGGLSNLYSSATGQLSTATSAITSAVGDLSGQLSSSLSSLSGQFNVGELSNLFAGSGLSNLFSSFGNFGGLSALGDVFGGGGDLVSGTQMAAGYNNTVNRSTVDAAFKRVLGSNKIPVPDYEYPSPQSISTRLDVQQAQTILAGTQNSQVFGQNVTIS